MSVEDYAWAIGQKAGSPEAKLVLLLIADSGMDRNMQPAPSVEWVAKNAEMSIEQVNRIIGSLITKDLITPTMERVR